MAADQRTLHWCMRLLEIRWAGAVYDNLLSGVLVTTVSNNMDSTTVEHTAHTV